MRTRTQPLFFGYKPSEIKITFQNHISKSRFKTTSQSHISATASTNASSISSSDA